MSDWAKPKILVSKCLEFDHCRYDGSMISSDFVKKIKPFVEFLPICPEVEIGLSVPRKSLRLIEKDQQIRLIQPANSRDFTNQMISFAESYLEKNGNVDGVILKSRSPSCGIKDVKLYNNTMESIPFKRTVGLFSSIVLKRFLGVVESEGRLRNPFIQEHFLASAFTLAKFKQTQKKQNFSDLVSFHSKNKFLFMAYNQELLKKMGQVAANQQNETVNEIFNQYEKTLFSVFSKPPSHKSTINVLMHLFGYVSDDLNKEEKKFFLELVEQYRNKKISLNAITHVLKSWVIRFSEPYLSEQTFFNPFPEDLLEEQLSVIADRQRYWK
jgi:uncharacterized protein YbgA (DUF1722 family)/uncharacterized protein YbbK (DUF523 family)